MAKKKYYAVKKGKVNGIFQTWDECKSSVDGVSGAEYQAFFTIEEAEAYLNDIDISEKHIELAKDSNLVIAYVDGSYDDALKKYSFGCVIITPEGEIIEESGANDKPEALESRNVAGELQGVMFAIGWACERGINRILIRHDYEGISKWPTGEWKAKSYCAIKYLEYMDKYKDKIEISFEKIKAHSGDKYNDRADELAKAAIKNGNKPKTKLNSGDTHFTVSGIELEEIETIINIIKEDVEDITFKKSECNLSTSFVISKGSERVSIIHYNTKKTVVQGKALSLFNMFVSYITELLDIDEITPVLNEYYKKDIAKEDIDDQISEYLPNITSLHSDKFKAALYQAIYNLNLNGDMYDYTHLTHPALRALDGHLRYIISKHKINMKDNFDMFQSHKNSGYKLQVIYESNFGSKNKISYINRTYNFYKKYRDPLFHWDTPIKGSQDTTRIINSKEEANRIIKETLSLINEYYVVK